MSLERDGRGVLVRRVVIAEHGDGTATVTGTRYGDGSWTWLRGWAWDPGLRLRRWSPRDGLDSGERREAVLLLARQLSAIGFHVATVLHNPPDCDTVER